MSKKGKIILIISILILILVPIATFATIKVLKVPTMDEKAIEEANNKENERALTEKENFAKEHENKAGASLAGSEVDVSEASVIGNDGIITNTKDNYSNKVTELLERYYSKQKIDELTKEVENSYTVMGDWTSDPLSDAEKELYGMVFDIIENNNLSEDESTAIKEFVKAQMSNIQKDSNLKERAERIIN